MADIEFEELVKLAEQLTSKQKSALIQRLLEAAREEQPLNDNEKSNLRIYLLEQAKERALTNEERKTLFHLSISSEPITLNSDRREDWYDDDGR